MNAEIATVVQFPHPGAEHNPPADDMPWNVGAHRRKFLRNRGRYLDADDELHDAEVVFWGEWEAPSRVERRWPTHGRLPRALHRPHWIRPTDDGFRQNTDPWVFGEYMRYSNCKQIVGPDRVPTSMQDLPTGSILCFGSTVDHEFCIDTVFVIAAAQPWTPAEVADIDVDDAFAAAPPTQSPRAAPTRAPSSRSTRAPASTTPYTACTASSPRCPPATTAPGSRASRSVYPG